MSGSYQSGKRTTVFFLFVAPLIRLQHRCTQKLSFTSPLITVFGLNDMIFQCHCCYFWLFRKQISYLCYTLQQNYSQFVHANVCNSRLCFLFRGCAGCDWKRTEQWKCLFLIIFVFSVCTCSASTALLFINYSVSLSKTVTTPVSFLCL